MSKVTSGEKAADDKAPLRRHAQTAFHVAELPDCIVEELGMVSVSDEAAQFNDEYNP
jgi:hypothetical protein